MINFLLFFYFYSKKILLFSSLFLMINEFFNVAIKFVWRQNTFDKTLAVMLMKFLAHVAIYEMLRRERKRKNGKLSTISSSFSIVFREEISFIFLIISFQFFVTNKFNYKILSFCVYFHSFENNSQRKKRTKETLMKQIVKRAFLWTKLFMCSEHFEWLGSAAWNNTDKV